LSQAEKDLSNGDCILVVAPHDSIAATSIVEKAKAQNVPVIAYDRLIQSKDLSYYVSFDNIQVGVLQAQYISQHYQAYAKPGQSQVNMVMVNGSQTDTNALLFSIGVHQVLDPMLAAGELTNTDETFTPNWDNSSAQTEMETFLADQNDNIQVAYVGNDGMAGAVIAALKAAGLAGKVLVTGQDATAAGINSILLGDQSMTVYKPIIKEAQSVGNLVKAIHDGTSTQYLTGGKVTATYDDGSIPSILDNPISVDISNIDSTVIAQGFLTRQQVCTGIAPNTTKVC
jgi:D-xylose transport system substrate-binding protein